MKKDFIVMDDVSFSFGEQMILNEVSLVLEKGYSYALIGQSGVGKSTFLNLVAGFLQPNSGQIKINGERIVKPRKETAFQFQELGLFPWQTVVESVSMPLTLGGAKQGIDHTVFKMLQEMGIEDHKDKYPQELSGGEQQRVALSRTLIGDPDLLLMDEPTSALDAMTKEGLQKLILKEQKKRQATWLFVTHDIEEAMILGKYIILMNTNGSVVQLSNPYYSAENPREQLGFYDECIKIRKQLQMRTNR